MATIEALVLNGSVTLFALSVLFLELLCLLAFRRWLSAPALIANGFSGVFLILALRAALLGPDAQGVALWLGLGFIAHLGDVILRFRR